MTAIGPPDDFALDIRLNLLVHLQLAEAVAVRPPSSSTPADAEADPLAAPVSTHVSPPIFQLAPMSADSDIETATAWTSAAVSVGVAVLTSKVDSGHRGLRGDRHSLAAWAPDRAPCIGPSISIPSPSVYHIPFEIDAD